MGGVIFIDLKPQYRARNLGLGSTRARFILGEHLNLSRRQCGLEQAGLCVTVSNNRAHWNFRPTPLDCTFRGFLCIVVVLIYKYVCVRTGTYIYKFEN